MPLVSIGIPTFNRASSLERAVRSALDQLHTDLEVVVSDDASTDDTPAVLERLAREDARLRHLQQQSNLGHARNFQAVLDAASGTYFMWLSDDDWIDPDYVSRCLAALLAEPGNVLVAGLASYHSNGSHVIDERPTDLLSGRPGARVLAYLARVNVNGTLFGLAPRSLLQQVGFRDVVGGDWLLVSALAARGRVRTLRDVHIHRSFDGLSSDGERLARSFGMRGLPARHHHFTVAGGFAREIAGGGAYATLSAPQRVLTAALAAGLIVLRFPVVMAVRALLERVGATGVERRVTAWVRRRD